INEETQYDDLRHASFEAACYTRWKSINEFRARAGNLDTHGKYMAIFSGGTHGDFSENQERFDEDYERMCHRHDQAVLVRVFGFSRTQTTHEAVNAWKECVKHAGFGLWSTIYLSEGSRSFSIEVSYIPAPGTTGEHREKLKLIGYTRDHQGFECKINNVD